MADGPSIFGESMNASSSTPLDFQRGSVPRAAGLCSLLIKHFKAVLCVQKSLGTERPLTECVKCL